MTKPVGHSVSSDQRAILEFIALADGEGCTLAHDIALELGKKPRGFGNQLVRLEKLGLVSRVVVGERPTLRCNNLYGWVLTDDGRSVVYAR